MVDRSRCKHIISRHYGYSVLVHLTLWVIPYLLTCRPVNLSPWVERLTGEQVHNIPLPFVSIFSSGRVNPELGQVMCYGYSVLVHLSTCQPVPMGTQAMKYYLSAGHYGYTFFSFVDLSICSQWLTVAIFSSGPVKRYVDVQCIMGRPYMPRGRPTVLVHLSIRQTVIQG